MGIRWHLLYLFWTYVNSPTFNGSIIFFENFEFLFWFKYFFLIVFKYTTPVCGGLNSNIDDANCACSLYCKLVYRRCLSTRAGFIPASKQILKKTINGGKSAKTFKCRNFSVPGRGGAEFLTPLNIKSWISPCPEEPWREVC